MDAPEAARPKMNADPAFRDAKLARIHDPHVQPLNTLVQRWCGEGRDVPWADPDSGGTHSRILFLYESPGPKAAKARGSGLISADNDDPSAARFWRLSHQAGLAPGSHISWNTVPWYLPGRNARDADAQAALPYLHQFVTLLPELRVVVLMGRFAQRWWFKYQLQVPGSLVLPTLGAPHTSNLAHTRDRAASERDILTAMTKAKQAAGSRQP